MVLLTITPTLMRAIQDYQKVSPEGQNDQASASEPPLEDVAAGQPISHAQIIRISRALRSTKSYDAYHLQDLLRGVTVYVEPPKPKPQQTEEYKTLMARLRRDAEERSYEAMIAQSQSEAGSRAPNTIAPMHSTDEEDEMTYSDVSRQLTLILNVLISIIFCAVSIWMAAWHWATPTRLFASMAGSIVVGVAEVVIYAGYIRRLKEAKTKEKKKKEVKSITDTWIIGKGINGGTSGAKKTSNTGEQHVRLRKNGKTYFMGKA
ncbi:hypothetical protein FH972_023037 [Carpinus fangiana]|uniref:Uncharacterized protein n=1 Tax=Carpinus fangiana TaxID=176857 RepID=A0A5N6KWA1_9ROSI|nr:hypothetical protein FH972_023037 [Carpinus fangiana]